MNTRDRGRYWKLKKEYFLASASQRYQQSLDDSEEAHPLQMGIKNEETNSD